AAPDPTRRRSSIARHHAPGARRLPALHEQGASRGVDDGPGGLGPDPRTPGERRVRRLAAVLVAPASRPSHPRLLEKSRHDTKRVDKSGYVSEPNDNEDPIALGKILVRRSE